MVHRPRESEDYMQGEKTVTTQIASECQIIPRLDDLVTVIK